MTSLYEQMQKKFFIMAGPNVIESEEHVLKMARQMKAIMDEYLGYSDNVAR